MPFYEYECPSCKHTEEVLQKITDKAIGTCPSCGKRGYRRLVSAPVFRLKGKGWYETDFKSDKEKQRNLVGNEVEPKAEAKSDSKTKTDAKADAKADTKADAKSETKSESKAESKPAAASGQAKNKRKSTPVKRAATPARKHK